MRLRATPSGLTMEKVRSSAMNHFLCGGLEGARLYRAAPQDLVFEEHGVRVFVDPESLKLIDGTTVDFVRQGLSEAFRFQNPNIRGECGCGESFNI